MVADVWCSGDVNNEAARRRQLVTIAVGLVLAMATWFSTAAVLGELRERWSLGSAQASWLTIGVQLGFVLGAFVSAATNLADRVNPRRLLAAGALGAAVANLAIVAVDGFGGALALRFATGAFLALVYPPALKVISSWYVTGRGFAMGVMIGALTIGSALPHLINAAGGLGWRETLVATSAVTILGGVIVDRLGADGPHALAPAVFDPTQLRALLGNRHFRLATAGYFGHMWELYAMWAWITAFYGDAFGAGNERWASLAGFGAIAAGAAGSVYAGLVSDRRSRSEAAGIALRWSGSVALVAGFLLDAPTPIVVGIGLVWGFWVVADSAQFSTIVTEVTEARYVGTALTIQLAAGFVLTVFTIFLVPVVRDAHGWGWAFLLLAPGPLLGGLAMYVLSRDVDEPRPQTQPEPSFVSPYF